MENSFRAEGEVNLVNAVVDGSYRHPRVWSDCRRAPSKRLRIG
jgi:hypothetical protein